MNRPTSMEHYADPTPPFEAASRRLIEAAILQPELRPIAEDVIAAHHAEVVPPPLGEMTRDRWDRLERAAAVRGLTPGAVYLVYGCFDDDPMYRRACEAADRALNSLPAAAVDKFVAALEAAPWAVRPEEEWAAGY